jgi:hypothetical protein
MVWLKSARGAAAWGASAGFHRVLAWSILIALTLWFASMLQTLASGLITEESTALPSVCISQNSSTEAVLQDGDDTRARFLWSYCRSAREKRAP